MPLTEHDLELLDRHLDGDLSDAEAVGFEARLASDPELSCELARLRELRSARVESFCALEPGDVENQRLQWFLRGAIHQAARERDASQDVAVAAPRRDRVRALVGGLSRVAAVLLVGFVVGYGLRSSERTTPSVGPIGPVAGIEAPGGRMAAGLGGGDEIRTVGSIPTDAISGEGFVVTMRDQFGNVITTRTFRTLQEARDFAGDIERWQQRYRQVQKNGVRFIGDDF
jgi:hypothetical protein